MAKKKAGPRQDGDQLTAKTFRVAVMLHAPLASLEEFMRFSTRLATLNVDAGFLVSNKVSLKLLVYAAKSSPELPAHAIIAGVKLACPYAWFTLLVHPEWRPNADLSDPAANLDDALRHCVERMDDCLLAFDDTATIDVPAVVRELRGGKPRVAGQGFGGVMVADCTDDKVITVKEEKQDEVSKTIKVAAPERMRPAFKTLWGRR